MVTEVSEVLSEGICLSRKAWMWWMWLINFNSTLNIEGLFVAPILSITIFKIIILWCRNGKKFTKFLILYTKFRKCAAFLYSFWKCWHASAILTGRINIAWGSRAGTRLFQRVCVIRNKFICVSKGRFWNYWEFSPNLHKVPLLWKVLLEFSRETNILWKNPPPSKIFAYDLKCNYFLLLSYCIVNLFIYLFFGYRWLTSLNNQLLQIWENQCFGL